MKDKSLYLLIGAVFLFVLVFIILVNTMTVLSIMRTPTPTPTFTATQTATHTITLTATLTPTPSLLELWKNYKTATPSQTPPAENIATNAAPTQKRDNKP